MRFEILPQAVAAMDPSAIGRVLEPILANIVYPVIYFLFALGVFVFAYGIFEMIIKGDSEARKTGRNHILFGVIGMAIMISAWGIVYFVSDSLKEFRNNFDNGGSNIQPINRP